MGEVSMIGLDLAKRSFQVHGAYTDGSVAFRKKLTRAQVVPFFGDQPSCVVAMEACATAHDWGREIGALGHEIKLIPPVYVKPFVKRQKNDAADAEAIAEAATRPTMRTVPVKSRDQQSRAVLFRTRDLLVRQRTQLINALRGHLAEYGSVAPKKAVNVKRLAEALDDPENGLPPLMVEMGLIYLDHIAALTKRIDALEKRVLAEANRDIMARQLQTMPGIGPVTAMAVTAFAPPMETFRRGRDFAAWLGLVPRQHSTGGRTILGKTSKMGQRDIRRLLIVGAMSVVNAALRAGTPAGGWLARMLERKPRLSERELSRVEVLAQVEDGRLTVDNAANLLDLTRRQVFRLLKRFRTGGAAAIRHAARGRPPNNRIHTAKRDYALSVIREGYDDFGPTLAAEMLTDHHGFKVSRETVRKWMV